MALTGSVIHKRPIPHEEGHWFDFRQLSWSDLAAARRAREEREWREGRVEVEAMGKEMFEARVAVMERAALRAVEKAAEPAGAKPADPALAYDPADLLQRAIKAWSYDAPVNQGTIATLDEQTMRWAVAEVVAIHHPPQEEAPTSTSTSP